MEDSSHYGEGRPRIIFAGGGTGGHLFPALAVAEELNHRHPRASIGFIGSRRGIENRLVPATGYPLRTLPLSGLKGASLAARLLATVEAAIAMIRCTWWMLRSRPDLVIGVGGYSSGPPVMAANAIGIRTAALEQNHFPGATNRFLARRVDRICLPSQAARERLGGRGIVTGNPVRTEFEKIGGIPGDETLSVLVFGGSRGAHSINLAVVEALREIGNISPTPLIVHQTGVEDEVEVKAAYESSYPAGRFEVHRFLDDMPHRLERADLVICRAGASTLSELAAAGRPAVLVPYPHAADDHQRHNAEAVASAGGAVVIPDGELDGTAIAATVKMLAGDRERLNRMAEAARELAAPGAAGRIADVLDELLGMPARETTEGGADVP